MGSIDILINNIIIKIDIYSDFVRLNDKNTNLWDKEKREGGRGIHNAVRVQRAL